MKLKEDTFLQGGKYKIVRHIASGGFGNTYEALDTSMGNARVAIKEFFVKDCCARDSVTQNVTLAVEGKRDLVAKLKAKFLAEAEAIRRLKHDNIVRVYSSFEENDTAYYVMEYIDGLSLEQYGKLDEATALKYIRQIADALSYVHNQKCLHLDIKPANILINKDDKAVLIDFGSSKYYDDGKAVTTTTMPGLYTPGYAPYEQTVGGITGFTPASDIYALGATLYRLLSGNTPPPSGTRLEDDVPLPLPYSISESTRKAVEMAMIPQKKTRTQTVDDFLRYLDGGINTIYGPTTGDNGGYTTIVGEPVGGNGGTPPPPPPPTTESNPFWKILFCGIAVIILIIVGISMCVQNQEPQTMYPPQDFIDPDTVAIDTVVADTTAAEIASEDTLSLLESKQADKRSYGEWWVGSLGGNLGIRMYINEDTDEFWYHYTKYSSNNRMYLSVIENEDNHLVLLETNRDGLDTGIFDGYFYGDTYSGTFSNLLTDKTFNFTLTRQ